MSQLLLQLVHQLKNSNTKQRATRIFRVNKGIRSKRSIDFSPIECPRQPSDSNVCAYYIARFMKEIKDNMLRDTPHQLKDMFCEAPYTRLDLDEIRKEWATVVHEYIISNAEDDL